MKACELMTANMFSMSSNHKKKDDNNYTIIIILALIRKI
jgi:hypothetical protein